LTARQAYSPTVTRQPETQFRKILYPALVGVVTNKSPNRQPSLSKYHVLKSINRYCLWAVDPMLKIDDLSVRFYACC